ncbi:MAG: hypothetical protein HFH41_04665 [Lachnospiraceae bacterium]|nr:hypothetical protein [Lachnospiraceae bacterium]
MTNKISQVMALMRSSELSGTQKNGMQGSDPLFGTLLSQNQAAGNEKQNMFSWNSNLNQTLKVNDANQTAYVKETSKNGYRENAFVKNDNSDIQSKLPEDVDEKLQTFEEKVTEAVAEELGVTEEEVKEAMEALGLTVLDLTDSSKLAGLVMELTGSEEVGELLLSEGFQQILKGIGALTEDLMAQLELTPEEMTQFLEQWNMAEDQGTAEILPQTPELETPQTGMENVFVETPAAKAEETVEILQTATAENQQVQNENPEVVKNPEESDQEGQIQVVKEQEQNPEETGQDSQEESLDKSLTDTAKDMGSKNTGKTEHSQSHVTYQTTAQTVNQGQAVEITQTIVQTRINVEDIMRQVSQMTKIMVSQAESSIEMQLNPANLGKVYLQVISREGVITAQLAAQNEAVKEALESQVAMLRENMNQQGIKVEAIEVTIASHEFERNLEENQQNPARDQQEAEAEKSSRRNINLNHPEELEGVMSEAENLAAKIMADQGNSVDLTA